MKQKNRIWIYSLIMGFAFMLVTCNEKNEDLPDYASEIAGTYYGTITVVGNVSTSASSKLTKKSDQVVDLEIKIGTTNIPLDGIKVTISSSGNDSTSSGDIYDLKYSDPSGSFTGKVEGNRLTWTLIAGDIKDIFSGTR